MLFSALASMGQYRVLVLFAINILLSVCGVCLLNPWHYLL